ncbi:ATP synthase subunit b precursor [compost metagenome]|jgi:F-type H+-transporting ATPase subunit b|uniref:ATP synthase subunit b n=2 Tax=Weeksellaceae TaxID=2762318 RepID=A0A4R8I7Q6_9FLAO|nr:F0F1 ATP synthase subunit B [Epilithonimonas sp. JDS]KFC21726.1 ATP F0F1 synthase subunit B [Chryseobacterium sp. FH1]RZJ79257.1 MAG: F0F1 ATP synthase subunit B [Chryseobacterium sp.]TDX86032.1 F-type H+-transporting ATPase subunit b [Epilithonimonas xixisoli]
MELLHQFSSGLFIIQSIIFLALLFLLGKFAWKPILKSIDERETSIIDALNQAKLAKQEMAQLKEDNERILREARAERDGILKEARDMKDKIVNQAKDSAKVEGEKMIEAARQSIQTEKNAAMADIKTQIGTLSVSIAENILKEKLDNDGAQNALVENILNKSNLN